MDEDHYIAYFGYGSLVNLKTLRTPYISAFPARLHGWKRAWLERPPVEGSFAPQAGLAFLSVKPDTNCTLDGMIVLDHASSLPSLDKREALYDRVELGADLLELVQPEVFDISEIPKYVYVATDYPQADDVQILQSYVDVVMQGYREHFGDQGLQRFMETTSNFECPILEDRTDPYYPRSVDLSDEERLLFDDLISNR